MRHTLIQKGMYRRHTNPQLTKKKSYDRNWQYKCWPYFLFLEYFYKIFYNLRLDQNELLGVDAFKRIIDFLMNIFFINSFFFLNQQCLYNFKNFFSLFCGESGFTKITNNFYVTFLSLLVSFYYKQRRV